MSSETFSLSWNQFGSSAQSTFRNLINDQNFTDVTLVSSDNKQIKAHKVILSSCSKFFNQILLSNPHQHPLLFLKDIRYSDLLSIIKFIYLGQTHVTQTDLDHFMAAAKVLQIEGLNENEEPVPESNVETKQVIAGKAETNFESANGNYEVVAETFVEELPSRYYDLQDEEEKYFPVPQVPNIYRNTDGKYSCDKCEYQAKQSGHLKAHIMGKHEGIKFKCEECDLQFSSKRNLQRHQHLKHEGKIYRCKECSFESGSSAALSMHKAKFHQQL